MCLAAVVNVPAAARSAPMLQLNCSWSLHTAVWRCLHHVTYQSKEQRTAFAENEELLRAAAEALNLPVLGAEGSTKGKVCPYKPSILWALYNSVRCAEVIRDLVWGCSGLTRVC